LIHKLYTFSDQHRTAKEVIRARVWTLYADLKAYAQHPTKKRKGELTKRFTLHEQNGLHDTRPALEPAQCPQR
jgi:hypothetical protein